MQWHNKVFSACWCACLWACLSHSHTVLFFIKTHELTDWRHKKYVAVEDLNWVQTHGWVVKGLQQLVLWKKTTNVNKSIKLNARRMLRKCHWLFIMGLLSGGWGCDMCYLLTKTLSMQRHGWGGNKVKDGTLGRDSSWWGCGKNQRENLNTNTI